MNKPTYHSMSVLGLSDYEISREGFVRNIARESYPGGTIDSQGYAKISLVGDDGLNSSIPLHVLLGLIFLGDRPSPIHTVDHINKIKSDNRLENLRWATPSEQSLNRDLPENKSGKAVDQLSADGKYIKTWSRLIDVAAFMGVSKSTMTRSCQDRILVGGFYWTYHYDEIDGETWKMVPSKKYDHIWVSTEGRVYSTKLKRATYGSLKADYMSISITLEKGCLKRQVHCLVAKAFIGKRPIDMLVNHKDGNKQNNKLSNLEYATGSENVKHAIAMGLTKSRLNSKSSKPVAQLDMNGCLLMTYPSVNEAERMTNISAKNISRDCLNSAYSAGGFRWLYIDIAPHIEEWRLVENDDYQPLLVSSYGTVKSFDNHTICKITDGSDWPYVSIATKNGWLVNVSLPHLVAHTYRVCDRSSPNLWHVDRNPRNNNISNLFFVPFYDTPKYRESLLPKSSVIVQLNMASERLAVYDNVKSASKTTGISESNIRRVCAGNRKSSGGFIWIRQLSLE